MKTMFFAPDNGYRRVAERAKRDSSQVDAEVAFTVRTYPLLAQKLAVLAKTVSLSRNQLVVELLQTACAEVFANLPQDIQEDVERQIAINLASKTEG